MRGRRLVLAILAATVLASGCGSGDDDATDVGATTSDRAAASAPVATLRELARTISTGKDKNDCEPVTALNRRSPYKFVCPSLGGNKPLLGFHVAAAAVYGTGAVVDYRTKDTPAASVVMFLDPHRRWGISRFGVVGGTSVGTSDSSSRPGFAEAVARYLAAVRERDCGAFGAYAVTDAPVSKAMCRREFRPTIALAKLLQANPDAKPEYQGGNETYGFYRLDLDQPRKQSFTISVIKTPRHSLKPFLVLDTVQSAGNG